MSDRTLRVLLRTAPAFGAAIALALAAPARAQNPEDCFAILRPADFSGVSVDLVRAAALADSAVALTYTHRRTGTAARIDVCGAPGHVRGLLEGIALPPHRPAVALLPAELLVVGNSAYPRDWNDGVLWGGRGLNMALTAGAELRLGPLTIAAAPILAWHTNRAFDMQTVSDTTRSAFSHPWWGTIDAPRRFGGAQYTVIDAGPSYARVDARGLAVGISNENIIWGPAQRNPLLLSATAPGFPHVFLETSRPIDIYIGNAELQLFWGRLEESEYFDSEPDNDVRVMAGLLVALQPRPLPGLSIGAGRLQSLTYWPELSLSDAFLNPYRGVTGNPGGRQGDNQLITAFFRWAASDLEVYGEWAREDHWGPTSGLLRNLDASHAWTVGLARLLRHGDAAWRVTAEVTHLSDALPILLHTRQVVPFYSNGSVIQGHTHRGQMLGAPIGTGGQAQFLGIDHIGRFGMTTLSIERARYEDDAYDVYFGPEHGSGARDVEISLRARHGWAVRSLALNAELGWSTRHNRDFLGLADIEGGEAYRRDDNFSLRIGARWAPEIAR